MNIFYLDHNPKLCAQYHNDKHTIKMIVETAQILSTAHRVLDGVEYTDVSSGRKIKRFKLHSGLDTLLYKATHINHPSNKWVRENNENYNWLYQLFVSLLDEYSYRYNKNHGCSFLKEHLKNPPYNISISNFIEPYQAMPEIYFDKSSIIAYRNYYISEKLKISKYTNRDFPYWLKGKKCE